MQVPGGMGSTTTIWKIPFPSLALLCSSTEASQETRSSAQKEGSFINCTETSQLLSTPRPAPRPPLHPLQSQEFNERKTSSGLVPFAASELIN